MSQVPTNTIFTDMQVVQASMLDPKHRLDIEDSRKIQRDFLMSYEYDAFITASGPTNDSYIVDVYENGYIAAAGPDLDPTRVQITAYVLHNEDFFPINSFVRIKLLPDNTAWILHQQPDQLAMIICKSSGDFTNSNYWVVPCYLADVDTTTFVPTKYPTNSRYYQELQAANLAEQLLDTHWLTDGMVVTLKWNYDSHRPLPERRWLFERTPPLPWIKITGNIGTYSGGGGSLTAPYHYSWIEQIDHDDSGESFADNPDGLSGTTTDGYALNVGETSSITSLPVPNGTITRLYIEYDDQCPSNIVYRIKEPLGSKGLWGTVVTAWSPGYNTLVLTPVTDQTGVTPTGAPNVTVSVEPPPIAVAQYCIYTVGQTVPYIDYNGDGSILFLVRNPLPAIANQYGGWYNTNGAPSNVVGDYLRAF